MGKLTDDMTRLVDEMQIMSESRDNFIKGIKETVKREADEVRSEMKSAHEAYFGRKTFRKR